MLQLKEQLRIVNNHDFELSIILITIVFVLGIKLLHPSSFRKLVFGTLNLNANHVVFIGFIVTLNFVIILSLITFPYIDKELFFYFDNKLIIILLMAFVFGFFITIKNILKATFFSIVDTVDNFTELIVAEFQIGFYKYIVLIFTLLFFLFSPFQIENNAEILISILFVIYFLDWIYFLFIHKNAIQNHYIIKILYLCTLEILPFLVWIKYFLQINTL